MAKTMAGNESLEEPSPSLSLSVPLTDSPNIVWPSLIPNFYIPNDGNWDTA